MQDIISLQLAKTGDLLQAGVYDTPVSKQKVALMSIRQGFYINASHLSGQVFTLNHTKPY
jgi:hypothetical protein